MRETRPGKGREALPFLTHGVGIDNWRPYTLIKMGRNRSNKVRPRGNLECPPPGPEEIAWPIRKEYPIETQRSLFLQEKIFYDRGGPVTGDWSFDMKRNIFTGE
jgi:hypothetical protein